MEIERVAIEDIEVATRNAVIEECAKIADQFSKGITGGPGPLWGAGLMRGAEIIALKIRELKK